MKNFQRIASFAFALFFSFCLQAQPTNWRAESDSILQLVKAAEDSTAKLVAQINAWKNGGSGRLSGRQQVQWALLMASLNGNFQTLLTYSDQYEPARKLSPQEFVQRFGGGSDGTDQTDAAIEHLRLLISLLETDRAQYAITESLRLAVGNSVTLEDRLNEGNRSFGIQYGIFEEMNAIFFDPERKRRTRGRYLQLQREEDFLATIKEREQEFHHLATKLLHDPTLQKIASQTDVSALFANSAAALGSTLGPAVQLATRTSYNLSQFFGNFVGTNLFRVADFLGIGESRGHALPAFYRYYPHPAGAQQGVHPEKVSAMAQHLQAGDVLFEKTRFAITDKLIPGYFGHVAIYLESYEALRELGVFNTAVMKQATSGMSSAAIEAQVEAYEAEIAMITEKEEWLRLAIMRRRTYAKTHNGRSLNALLFEALYRLKHGSENVLEALRDGQTISAHEGGVTVNRFEHFLYIDDFAAIRLRQGEINAGQYRDNLARFLALGLLQYGKPYDFKFDVNTLDAIVCSELIYQSFVDVDFSTGKSLGSYTISPDQVAQTAGIKTVLDTLHLDPPFELSQWYLNAIPFYPPTFLNSTAGLAAMDSLIVRAFMAMVREEAGGLQLFSEDERERFEAFHERTEREREKESKRLRHLPAARMTMAKEEIDRESERRLQEFYIELNRKTAQARAAGQSEAEIAALKVREIQRFSASFTSERATALTENTSERAAALAEAFETWQRGAAYRPSYIDLYSGGERFFLSVFRSAAVADDDGFGRGLDVRLAGNNEAPRRSLIYNEHYSFLPFHFQFFNHSGKVHKTLQGGAALARISRRYSQGDYVEMNALAWRNDAYATSFLPFALEAGGDKGPLDAVLELMTIGNGDYQRFVYVGEIARLELAPYEIRNDRRAFTITNLFYGAHAQFTLGKFRLFANGQIGIRVGEFGERKHRQIDTAFPPIRAWSFGIELLGSTLYRPSSHRLEFAVIEDDARFIQGQLQKDRQARISYRWSLND